MHIFFFLAPDVFFPAIFWGYLDINTFTKQYLFQKNDDYVHLRNNEFSENL